MCVITPRITTYKPCADESRVRQGCGMVLIVEEGYARQRIDCFLASQCQISRTRIQKWIRKGCVTRNQRVLTHNHTHLHKGDTIEIRPPSTQASHIEGVEHPLHIVWEDDHILVLNKQAGLTVHPGPGHVGDTLVNALLHRYGPSFSVGDVQRPGLVHRLDRHTSGLMVVAKQDHAYHHLVHQLQNRTVKRTYRALVLGRMQPAQRTVDAPIGRHPRHRQKQAVVACGRRAVTHIQTLHTWPLGKDDWVSEWLCHLETGRTHQIRVHAQHVGCPIVGDAIYGRTMLRPHYLQAIGVFGRQALHAMRLEFTHPYSMRDMRFEVIPPEDYMQLQQSIQTFSTASCR